LIGHDAAELLLNVSWRQHHRTHWGVWSNRDASHNVPAKL